MGRNTGVEMMNAELMKFIIQSLGLRKHEVRGRFEIEGEFEVEFIIRRLK